MEISKINASNMVFKSKSEGSEHKIKTFKYIGAGLFTGIMAENIVKSGGFKNYAQCFQDDFKTTIEDATSSSVKEMPKMLKNMAKGNMFFNVFFVLACCIGGGAIIDGIVNAVKNAE